MTLFEDLSRRGLAHQWTGEDEFPEFLREGSVTLYCGFDPTSDSLHIGSLVPLTLLRRFQHAGHRPIAVAGGATGMIGDPSFKSEERTLLTPETIERHLEGIRPQIEKFLDFGTGGAILVNNADWFRPWSYIDFLRDVGKHFSVNAMLAKESVKARVNSESGLSYTEFSYMLMQAYDFVHLNERYGCRLQVGGSDQFGNITAGIDLARRMRGVQLFGMTAPLVTRADGEKFGKTATGANIWLSPARTSPYAFYQFFVNTADDDAGRYLRLFTELPVEDIENLEASAASNPGAREAQRALARSVTSLVHGESGLLVAERATGALFGGDLQGLSEGDLLEIFADVPSGTIPASRLGAISAADALMEAGLAKSKGEARRLVEGGGGYVNNRRIDTSDEILTSSDLASETVMVLRAGKKSFALLRFER